MIKLLSTLLLFIFAINISNACVITASATSSNICLGKKDTLSVSGATTYTWMPGNIHTSTFTVQPSATTTYTVYSTDTAGCLDTAFVTVSVDSLPTTVVASASNSTVCQGISPILTGSGAATYSWMPGAFTGNPYNALPNINTIYTVTGATAQGCTKTATININVTLAPKPILQDSFAIATFGTPFSNCNNLSGSPIYTITVSTPANATITSYSINWGNGGGTINGLTAASFPLHYTYPNFGVYNLVFTAHYANGCSRDSIIPVINQTNPAIGISNVSGNTSGCGPIGYWFQMSNYQANATGTYYVWDFGDGTPTITWTNVTTDSIFHMFTTSSCGFPNNEFTVSITAINSCSFTKATVSSIKVFKKPEPNFTTNVTNGCVGTPISFSNTSILSQNAPNCNTNSNWNWNFGDGSPNEFTANVTHTYNNAGTYTVTLIGTGGCGADTIQAPICVEENIVNFNSSIASLCAPATIALNNTSPTSTNCTVTPYTWSVTKLSNTCPSDSSANSIYLSGNSTSATPTIRINNQGTYRIRLSHTNSCGTIFKDTIITISRKPNASISSAATLCNGELLNPIANVTNCSTAPITYLWNAASATPSSSTSANPSLLFPVGTHTFSVTVTNDCGSNTIPKSITIHPLPIIGVTANPNTTICAGTTVTLTANGANFYSWAGGTLSGSGTTKTFTANATTTYTITGTNSFGCSSTTSITVNVNPKPSIIATNTIPTCVPGNDATITLSATGGTPAYSYQLNGGSIGSSPIFPNLGIGIYTCTVVDLNNCTASTIKNIITPNAPSIVSVVKTNVSCNGLNNGNIQLNTSGGTGTLQFVLQPGNISGNGIFANLSPNTYTIIVTDANGCSTVTTSSITQPPVLSWVNISASAVNCFGTNSGSISVSATGGTLNYSYVLSPTGQTNNNGNFTSKPAGNYTITLTDAKGCTISTTTTISQPTALIWDSVSKINLNCANIATGEIHTFATGGSGTIQYTTNPTTTSNTTGIFINLSATNYTVYATDGNGCVLTTIVTITQPTALQIVNISGVNPSCNPGGDGTITVNATGGTGSIVYQLNTNTTTSNTIFNNLSSGIYTITISDAKGCTSASTKSLITPNAPIFNSASKINVACNAQNNGSIAVTASSVNGAISYTLMPGNITNTTGNFASLPANIYSITATDNIGCNAQTILTITQPSPFIWASSTIIPASCFGSLDGSINAQATGGTVIYTYTLLPNNVSNTTGLFTNLPASNYTINCVDAKGCSISTNLQITQAPTLNINSLSTTNVSCFGLANGSITVSTVGGNGTISFTTNPSTSTVTNGLLTNLAASNYTIIATDANGCTKTSTTVVTQPTAISWSNFIKLRLVALPAMMGLCNLQFLEVHLIIPIY